ncbi:MAG: helix-turn-helix transcriptional regulator [bacterium]|nr:helix-turn-helix transcriptional regulator [bacterium]
MKIKELRIKAGYTSYENFAMDHGFARRYYWSVEKGRSFSMNYFFKILDALETTPEKFFQNWD